MSIDKVPLIRNLKNPNNPLLQRIISYPDDVLFDLWKNKFKIDLGLGWNPSYVYEEKVNIATEIMEHFSNKEIIIVLDEIDKKLKK